MHCSGVDTNKNKMWRKTTKPQNPLKETQGTYFYEKKNHSWMIRNDFVSYYTILRHFF